MADVKLHDGTEITFDLYKFTVAEYKVLFTDDSGEKQDALISLAAGLKDGEIKKLSFPDGMKLSAAFYEKCRSVTKDPNSESAST